jgi:hypothetical protein
VRRDGGAAGVATVADGWWMEPKEAEPFGEEDPTEMAQRNHQ